MLTVGLRNAKRKSHKPNETVYRYPVFEQGLHKNIRIKLSESPSLLIAGSYEQLPLFLCEITRMKFVAKHVFNVVNLINKFPIFRL